MANVQNAVQDILDRGNALAGDGLLYLNHLKSLYQNSE